MHTLIWLNCKDFSLLIHHICCMSIFGYCELRYLANGTNISEARWSGHPNIVTAGLVAQNLFFNF